MGDLVLERTAIDATVLLKRVAERLGGQVVEARLRQAVGPTASSRVRGRLTLSFPDDMAAVIFRFVAERLPSVETVELPEQLALGIAAPEHGYCCWFDPADLLISGWT